MKSSRSELDARLPPAMRGEANVYAAVYHALVYGMAASSALFAAGMIVALTRRQTIPLTSAWVRGQMRWSVFWPGLWRGDPTALMLLATVILILTPVSRVVLSVVAFLVDRDYRFAVVAGIVLLVIIVTVILAQLGLR